MVRRDRYPDDYLTDYCIFCETTEELTEHHIIPKSVKKVLGWRGRRTEMYLGKNKTMLCRTCHDKVEWLLEPMVYIIKMLMPRPVIPLNLAFILDRVNTNLNEDEE